MPKNGCTARIPRNRLAELRQEDGLSQAELGSILGVNAGTISRWENLTTGIPDHYKQQLAEHFGVKVAHLMRWRDEEAQ